MALPKNTAAYRVAEYLCELGGATRRDVLTALGPGDNGVSQAMKELEEESLTQKRTFGKTEYVILTREGRRELEGGDPHYREYRAQYAAYRFSKPSETVGFREAASLCLRSYRESPELAPKVYRKDKPAPGLLFRVMFSEKTERAQGKEENRGYLAVLSPEEMDRLLETGILYSSAELKRCFAGSALPSVQGPVNRGAESVNSSRITAFLFRKTGVTVFFRSAGPIPRFRYETEEEMIRALMDSGPRYYPPFQRQTDIYGRYRPTAVMIGRSGALVTALIMGYSKGRVKSPRSMENSEWARKSRRYYEERLFNPCCGLFGRVFCLPYFASCAEELRFVLESDPFEMQAAGTRWCGRNLPRCGPPQHEAAFGCSVCAGDRDTGADVIYSPAVDVSFYRGVLRAAVTEPAFERSFTVVTQPKYADALSRATGKTVARFLDVFTGEELHPRAYDIYGYPEDGSDPYAEASRKRWSSPERPEKLAKVSLRITQEAAGELKSAAEKAGCTVSRLAGHLVASCLDSREWEERFGRPAGKTEPYAERLFLQDRRAGTNPEAADSLSSLFARREVTDDGS